MPLFCFVFFIMEVVLQLGWAFKIDKPTKSRPPDTSA